MKKRLRHFITRLRTCFIIFVVMHLTNSSEFHPHGGARSQCTLQEIIQPTEVPNLSFISAGPVPPNPTELLSSTKFVRFLEELKNQFDIIIVDTPPLLVADTLHVSANVDGCLYVVNAESSKVEQSIYSIDLLKQVQAPLVGTIINKSKGSARSNYYYN